MKSKQAMTFRTKLRGGCIEGRIQPIISQRRCHSYHFHSPFHRTKAFSRRLFLIDTTRRGKHSELMKVTCRKRYLPLLPCGLCHQLFAISL